MYDYPVHDGRRFRFSSPEELKKILLQYYPLTREFIDWVNEQGFRMVYWADWKEGTGSVWWGLRQIGVSSKGEAHLIDKTLVHEIIHISVPGHHEPEREYEEAIDEVAEVYLTNQEFMDYLKRKIPTMAGR